MYLHSTKVQALEHELAGVKEDRKRWSHYRTICDEVRNWGGKKSWCAPLVRAVGASGARGGA